MTTDSVAASLTSYAGPTPRVTLNVVGYWLAWSLFFILYWQTTSPAVDDAFWLVPVVLWLTLPHIPSTTEVDWPGRILATALAVAALGQVAILTYMKLEAIAQAIPYAPGHRAINLWSLPARTLASAFLTSILLAPLIIRTLGARIAQFFCALLLVCSTVELLDSLLSLDRWVNRPISNLILLNAAIGPPLVLGVSCHIVALRSQGLIARLKRMTPETLQRLWRGQTPRLLIEILFVVGLAVVVGLFFVRMSVPEYLPDQPHQDSAAIAIWVVMLLILYLVSVPAWRAYGRARSAEAGRARVGLCIFVSPFVLMTLFIEGSRIGFMLGPIAEQSIGSSWHIQVTDDPSELELRGALNYGVAEALAAALKQHPTATRLRLDSPGGYENEALSAVQLLRDRQLTTYVSDECLSACTLIFAAGQERIIGPEGQLGFHSVRFGNPFQDVADESLSEGYIKLGIDPEFVDRVTRVSPASMWYPTHAELLAARIVTQIDD